jgi:hypothetical protein
LLAEHGWNLLCCNFALRRSKNDALAGLDRTILNQTRLDPQNAGLGGHLEHALQAPEVAEIHLILAGGGIAAAGNCIITVS